MTSIVKKFIETNIENIENNKWEQLFLNWYNATALDVWPDSDEFEELCNMLIDVDILDLKTIKETVEPILTHELRTIMSVMKQSQEKVVMKPYIDCYAVSNKLNSHLGFKYNELVSIMNKVASELKLTYTDYYGGGYIWS